MKKYIKPAIEELNVGATMSLMSASMPIEDSDDERPGYNEYSVGRKDKDYDFDDEGW